MCNICNIDSRTLSLLVTARHPLTVGTLGLHRQTRRSANRGTSLLPPTVGLFSARRRTSSETSRGYRIIARPMVARKPRWKLPKKW